MLFEIMNEFSDKNFNLDFNNKYEEDDEGFENKIDRSTQFY